MVLRTNQIAIGSSPVNIMASPPPGHLFQNAASVNDAMPIYFENTDAANTVWVGGSDVTVSIGLPIGPTMIMPMELWQSDTLYAVTNGPTVVVAVMLGRQQ